MFTTEERYAYDEGEKAGTAARQGDWSRVKFISDHFRKSLPYLDGEKSTLQKRYDEGYKEGYGLPLGGYR
jgi:hypothetical protein